jgi:hypothetical protein
MNPITQRLWGLGLAALMFTGACGGGGSSSSPSSPSPPAASGVSLAGQWKGTATDSSGPGTITMQVTQTGTDLSGTVTMTVTGVSTTGRGTLTGTLSGTSIQLTIAIPAGGFDAPYTNCNASVSGSGQASASSITATYTGTNSCSGPVTGGQLTVSKG